MNMFIPVIAAACLACSSSVALAETPAANCLESVATEGFGSELVDDFLSQNGLADKPENITGRLRGFARTCIERHEISEEQQQDYMQLNIGNLMMGEVRKRLNSAGANMGGVDALIAAGMPTVDTTYPELMVEAEASLEQEVERIVGLGVLNREMATALLGSYTGFVHTAVQSGRRIGMVE